MRALLRHRAVAQFPLLAAVLAVVVVGATLLGVSALVLTVSQERALEVSFQRSAPGDVSITAYASGVTAGSATAVAAAEKSVLTTTFAPLGSTTASLATSSFRRLPGPGGARLKVGYLAGLDDLAGRADLVSGRWPVAGPGALEAVVLQATARNLGIKAGDVVHLGDEVAEGGSNRPVTVTVVGEFRPRPDSGWDYDPLGASGFEPAYQFGYAQPGRAYGPFVVPQAELFASGSGIDRLQVVARPDRTRPTGARLAAVNRSLAGADGRLRTATAGKVQIERVASQIPLTLATAHAQQAATRSVVLVVVLLGLALSAVVLGLAGRLVTDRRREESALLVSFGASRRQLLAIAGLETLVLAVVASVLAVPLSALGYAALTHRGALVRAGLAASATVTLAQVATIVVGALALAVVLAGPALRPDPGEKAEGRSRLSLLSRSGADVALVLLAGVGWWQLRSQPVEASGPDVVRVLAPVLFLVAGAAIVLRLAPPVLAAGDRAGRRARGLVWPLAFFDAARRAQVTAAGLLLALAAGVGMFAVGFDATWHHSQVDQADARIGTDLAVALTAPAEAGQGASLLAAAGGGVVSPVTSRPVSVGQSAGSGPPPQLVALDLAHAGALLRGRPPAGTSWADVGATLVPAGRVSGVAVPAGARLTMTGTHDRGPRLQAVPEMVLEGSDGLRTACPAPPVELDGRPHAIDLCGAAPGSARIVGLALQLQLDLSDPRATSATGSASVTVDLDVSGAPTAVSAGTWPTTAIGTDGGPAELARTATTVTGTPSGARIRTTTGVMVGDLFYDPAQSLATSFPRVSVVPVDISQSMATNLGLRPGQQVTLTTGSTPVRAAIVGVVPEVPSAPGAGALLADSDTLSRVLISADDLEPPVDAWWVGDPGRADAGARVAALSLGAVQTREAVRDQLTGGPLRVGLPAALGVLLVAVVLLVLAGLFMHVTSDLQSRREEIARLRGLGLPRRGSFAVLLLQHGGTLALLLLLGALVGGAAAEVVAPLLIRSDVGAAPVPAALARWPWPAETALLAGLFLAGTAVVAAVVAVQVSRADAADLQADA